MTSTNYGGVVSITNYVCASVNSKLCVVRATCICKVSKLGKEFCAFVPAETALVEPNPHESTPITDLPAKEKASRSNSSCVLVFAYDCRP
jgi:hypothetical protein